jgi:hypothetical protein
VQFLFMIVGSEMRVVRHVTCDLRGIVFDVFCLNCDV